MSAPALLPIEIQPWKTQAAGEGPSGNEQHIYRFTNGYGASVVQGPWTYGGPEGLWELAVLKFDGDESDLTYDTPITDDVLGRLTVPDVAEALARIAALPSADDPPEYDPEDAEAQRIAETYADAAAEMHAAEAEGWRMP